MSDLFECHWCKEGKEHNLKSNVRNIHFSVVDCERCNRKFIVQEIQVICEYDDNLYNRLKETEVEHKEEENEL